MPFIEYGDKRILFIHIPKTGGTTIDSWLNRSTGNKIQLLNCRLILGCTKCNPQHFQAKDLYELFSPGYFHYIFSIVRNPYKRFESEYRYRVRLNGNTVPPFSEWAHNIFEIYARNPWYLDNHIRPQFEFLHETVRVFHFEDGLGVIMRAVSELTGIPYTEKDFKKTNGTENVMRTIMWTHEIYRQVNKLYEKDFKLFAYPMVNH